MQKPRSARWFVLWAVALALASSSIADAQTSLGPDDALARAIEANPELRAAFFDALASRSTHEAAVNGRHATFVASANGQLQENLSATAGAIVRNLNRQGTASVGIRYTTAWGTQITFDVTSGMQTRVVNLNPSTSQLFRIGPMYSAETKVTLRQPLLRGAGADSVLAEVDQTAASAEASELDRVTATSEAVQDVMIAYWELWYADQELAVQRASLEVTERQREEARIRAESLGTSARTDVLAFATEVGSIRESIATSDANRASRAIELGRYLGTAPAQATAFAADAGAPEVPEPASANHLMVSARTRSPKLAAAEARLEATRVQLAAAHDASQPRLDVVATGGLLGLWTQDSLPGLTLPNNRPAGYGTVGLELELPIGPSRGRAEYAQAGAELDAAEARYQAEVLAMQAEIGTQSETLEGARRRVELALETAETAHALAEAERQKLALGTTTSFDVLRAQQTERETELRSLRARVDAVTASLRLDHAAGRLLDRFSVAMPDGSP